jgi:long-subunit acyl-CoA synthetase (AMP-forming)
MDSHGTEISEDCRHGELLVRGPALMTGYLGNPEATEQSFVNGWLKTGDVGYFQQGNYYIVDRVKVRESCYSHQTTNHYLTKYNHLLY